MTRYDEWAAHLDPEVADHPVFGPDGDALDRIGDALTDRALWDEPPPSLRDRIMAEASLEGPAPVESAGEVIDPFEDGEPLSAAGRARSKWFGVGLAAVAGVAVAVIAVFAVPWAFDATDGDVTTYAIAGTDLAPEAVARVDVDPQAAGVAITLHITGLPPAGPGQYYAGWLNGPEGSVGIGSFHWREGGIPIELWSGVDVERYPNIAITLQDEGEPTTSSGVAVLRGTLAEVTAGG
ncbi:MAG: anti-sigma factor [Actinomycetota bacterium]